MSLKNNGGIPNRNNTYLSSRCLIKVQTIVLTLLSFFATEEVQKKTRSFKKNRNDKKHYKVWDTRNGTMRLLMYELDKNRKT